MAQGSGEAAGRFNKLGIEKVGAIIARGVLIDVAGSKGVDMLGDTYEITVEDLEGALKKQNLSLYGSPEISGQECLLS
jgi:hypothetical protein